MVLLNLIIFSLGQNLYSRPFFERTRQEEKSDWEEVSSPAAESALIVLLATVRPLPWTKSFNFEGARGGFCFKVSGCWWWWFFFCFFFFKFWCVCVCVHRAQVAHLIFTFQEMASPLDSRSADCQTREKTLLAAVPPGSSCSRFDFVFPSAGTLDSSLVIICLWKWETGIVDPAHILNL